MWDGGVVGHAFFSTSMAEPLHAERHAAYAAVEPLCAKYPAQAGALFQTYVDLKYAARWRALDVHDTASFGKPGWAIIVGEAPDASDHRQVVVPLLLEQTVDTRMFTELFAHLPPDAATTHILLALMSNDATVVYYKLSQGLVKPVN